MVRVTYPDLIGTDRARDVLLDQLPTACEHGLAFCRAVYHTTPQGDVVPVPGGLDAGLPDIHVRPDLDTLIALPWEPGVATCLGETIDPATGAPAPESPRDLLRSVLARCAEQGLRPVVGPELEYFLCDADPASPSGWRRYSGATGAVYTAGLRADPDNHLLRTLRQLRDLGIGVINGNHEFDGGQFEINLTHSEALSAADRAFRFKAAVKELARKEGRLATFMAKPFNDAGGSGFHLHLSCDDERGTQHLRRPGGPVRAVRHGPPRHRRCPRPRPGPRRARQPDGQLLQAVRPGHPRALADRLGAGQPQRHGPHPARARLRRPSGTAARRRRAPTRIC